MGLTKTAKASRTSGWEAADWMLVAVGAKELMDSQGLDVKPAIIATQAVVLPPKKRREAKECHVWLGTMRPKIDKYLHLVSRMTPKARKQYLEEHSVAPDSPAPQSGRVIVKWNLSEVALVGREVARLLKSGGNFKNAIREAQRNVLPPERWITQGTINFRSEDGWRERFAEAEAKVPYVAPRLPSAQTAKAALAEPPAPAPVPTPPPPQDIEPERPFVTVQEGPAEEDTPAAVFGRTMMGALDVLLRTHTATLARAIPAPAPAPILDTAAIAAEVERRVSEQVQSIEERVAQRMLFAVDELSQKLLSTIEGSMRSVIKATLLEELGGPSDPKAPAPEAAPRTDEASAASAAVVPFKGIKHDPMPRSEEKADRLKIDVVGLLDSQAATLLDSLGDVNADVRCITQPHVRRWHPRDGVAVLIRKFISHDTQDLAKKHKVKIVYHNTGPNEAANTVRLAVQQWEADRQQATRTQQWQARAGGGR